MNRNLVKEYHKIQNINIFNKEEFETELIQRLNYEIIFNILDVKTLKDNTFLINNNDNCKRDDGHQLWMIIIIKILIENKINSISFIKLDIAIEKYNTYVTQTENKRKNSYENLIKIFVKELSENDALESVKYIIKNNEDYNSDNGWKYYSPPIFNYNGNIDQYLIYFYEENYTLYYEQYYNELYKYKI
jgi:hypothetical protein